MVSIVPGPHSTTLAADRGHLFAYAAHPHAFLVVPLLTVATSAIGAPGLLQQIT